MHIQKEGRPAVMASRPSQHFCDSLLHGIGWFFLFFCGIGGAGGLNFVVVLFCFCLFYFKLCLCVELWVVRMRCFIYDTGYIGSDGPVLVSNPRKIRSRDVLVSVVAFLLLCL